MSKTWYEKLLCEHCGEHIGYYIEAGPGTGCGICESCYENEPDTEYDEVDDDA